MATSYDVVVAKACKVLGKTYTAGDKLGSVSVEVDGMPPDTVCHALTTALARAIPADPQESDQVDASQPVATGLEVASAPASSGESASETPGGFDPNASAGSPPEKEDDKPTESKAEQDPEPKKEQPAAKDSKAEETKAKKERKPPAMPKEA